LNPGPRISKDPEVRKEELIDAAEALFEEKGYDDTAVSDIVRKVGVAQGTFYLYFRSKEEVLEAFADRLVNEFTVKMREIEDDPGRNAMEKFVLITRASLSLTVGREKMTDLIHEERNAILHYKLEKRMLPSLINTFTRVIEQGNREGLFDVPYPREAAIAVLGISQQFGEGTSDHTMKSIVMESLERILDIIERVLGAKKGTFLDHYKELGR
jgi:AcrR family transcriptional regulator